MSVALSGFYETCCAVVAAPVADVTAMLGDNVVLDRSQTLAPPGEHPFVVLMGTHRDVHVKFLPGRWNYREALVAIPWVRHKGKPCGPDPLAYNERLWLDRLPVVIGGWLWGFPKVWSRVSDARDAYSVRTLLLNRPVIEARFRDRGAPGPPESFPNFAPVRPVFEQDFIQRFLLVGPTIVSKLTFELDKATVQPIEAEVALQGRTYKVPGLDQTPLGAFRLALPWTLTPPRRC